MFIKKGKLSLVLVLILIMSVFLAACGSSDSPDPTVNSGDSSGDSSGEQILIRFSHNQPTASPEHAGAEKFKEVAESMGNGRINVELYPAGQMGSLREQVEGVQIGTIDISMQPSAVISPFVDDIKICDLPYLWPSDREVTYEVLDGEMGKELLGRLDQGGFHGLGYWFGGYKLLTTDGVEVHSPADLSGVKMRVMEAPILLSQFNAWGASPVALPYAELYNGLQQGIVDGQENPLQTIFLNNYHEVQDQIIQSYHGGMIYVMIANEGWFDGLPADIQDIIVEAEYQGRVTARETLADTEADYIEQIRGTEGINYYELTDEEIAVFAEASRVVHEEHYSLEWQKDYIERLYVAIEDALK